MTKSNGLKLRGSEASSSYDAVSEEPFWELKNTFTEFITGQTASFKSAVRVAAFQSGEIVVAETKKNCLIDFLMRKETSKTKPKSVLIPQSCRYLKHLEGLAVNTKDQIIVQDGDQIKIFDRNYKMISEFTPGYRPSCLAVDDNDLIVLCHSAEEQMTVHYPDGTLVRTLSTPIPADHMTIYKQRIIFTNSNHRKLCSIDCNGGEVFSVGILNGEPRALCCDSDGYIFVDIWQDLSKKRSTYRVHHFNPNGEYIGNIIKNCFVYDITCTPAGDLVMASGSSVKIYHHA